MSVSTRNGRCRVFAGCSLFFGSGVAVCTGGNCQEEEGEARDKKEAEPGGSDDQGGNIGKNGSLGEVESHGGKSEGRKDDKGEEDVSCLVHVDAPFQIVVFPSHNIFIPVRMKLKVKKLNFLE